MVMDQYIMIITFERMNAKSVIILSEIDKNVTSVQEHTQQIFVLITIFKYYSVHHAIKDLNIIKKFNAKIKTTNMPFNYFSE